jgi:voltage-gated potassium channel
MATQPPVFFVNPDDRPPLGRLRYRLHEILEASDRTDFLGALFDVAMVTLIIANVIAFAAATVDTIGARYSVAFEAFNVVSVLIFTIEYAARVWASVDSPLLRHLPPWKARLRFAVMPLPLIDLFAIVPFYLGNLFGIDLRVLRILRLARFLKIVRYSPALQTLLRVIRSESRALLGTLIIMVSLILISATAMFFIEHEAQPQAFGSVPAAMWWSLATLTTVGYGDVVPVTAAGRMIGGLFMIFGLAMYALPIGILSSGFAREISRREFVITWNMVARVPLFEGFDARAIAEVMDLLQAHRRSAGSILLRPSEPAEAMYFISAGAVRIEPLSGEAVVLEEGDHFGEVALLEKRRHMVTVVAQTDCQLLELGGRDFDYLLRRHPQLEHQVKRLASTRRFGETGKGDPAVPDSGEPDIPHSERGERPDAGLRAPVVDRSDTAGEEDS